MVIIYFKEFKVGIYVTVFKKVFNRSLAVLILPILTWLAFLFAFRFNYRYALYFNNSATQQKCPKINTTNNTLDIGPNMFNESTSHSLIRLITMTLGDYQNNEMGLGDEANTINLNYIIYLLAVFLLPLLIINIFMGISVDELRRMIDASHNHNVRLRCEYVLKIQDVVVNLLKFKNARKLIEKLVLFKTDRECRVKRVCKKLVCDSVEKKDEESFRVEKRKKKKIEKDEWKETMAKYMRKMLDKIENMEDHMSRMQNELGRNRKDIERLAARFGAAEIRLDQQ